MIRIRSLTVSYRSGPPALSGVSLGIAGGEMVGLLGPNGSGKTTLLRAIAGSLPSAGGEILVDGNPVASLAHKERARRMAFVPQRPEAVPDLTVFETTLMGRYPHRAFMEDYTPEDAAIARRALEDTALSHLAERPVRTLSGGEMQRVFVARAFAQQADILLLDEATTGLDPAHATALLDRVRARNQRRRATVLMAIHDLNLAALYCDRLVFLRRGAVLADGPTREVFTAATLRAVYDAPFLVLNHPANGLPQALSVPGTATREENRA